MNKNKNNNSAPIPASAARVPLRKLTATALLAAMGTALAVVPRLLTWGDIARLDLAILPVIVAAIALGPVWSACAYGLTDLLGCLLQGYTPFLPILACKLLVGLWLGLCLYRHHVNWKRSLLCLFVAGVVVDFALMGLSFRLFYGKAWIDLIVSRGITASLNFAVRMVFLAWAAERLSRLLCRAMHLPFPCAAAQGKGTEQAPETEQKRETEDE